MPDQITDSADKPVAVLGMGLSGQSVGRLLTQQGRCWRGHDENPGRGYGEDFRPEEYSLAVVSPGIAEHHPWLERGRKAGLPMIGEFGWAATQWPGELWVVTGTNGKTTLTLLLAELARRDGRKVRVVGNIGVAFSGSLADEQAAGGELAIAEVSSFQALMPGDRSPDVCFWTNFAEDHLDWHGTLEAYFRSKYTLAGKTAAGGGLILLGPEVHQWMERMNCPVVGNRVSGISPELVAGSPFARMPQRENASLAYQWWHLNGGDDEIFRQVVQEFTLPPHRLACCGVVDGISFWEDSKATNFAATEAALEGFPEPVHWLGGGKSKGGEMSAFVDRIHGRVRRAYLFGETAPILRKLFAARGVPCQSFPTLESAVAAACQNAGKGEQIVLSPGFSSLDQFSNFAARGQAFREAVKQFTSPQIFN